MSGASSLDVAETRWWGMSYAKVHTRLLSTALTKAQKAETDKHRLDQLTTALSEARGIAAALERVILDA